MMTKADIRRQIREQRQRLTLAWVRHASDRIQPKVLTLEAWAAARQICCYLATPTEVQTDLLLDACWKLHPCVWVPAFHATHRRYERARLHPGDALTIGRWKVPEPAEPDWTEPEPIDLVVVPGLAFDPSGGRIGHGQGYYDGLLAQEALRSAFKVGLAFAFQLQDQVPVSAHDVRMDAVVTETTVYRCQPERNGHQDTKAQRMFGRKSSRGCGTS